MTQSLVKQAGTTTALFHSVGLFTTEASQILPHFLEQRVNRS